MNWLKKLLPGKGEQPAEPDTPRDPEPTPDKRRDRCLAAKDRGNACLGRGDVVAAETCYREALAIDPDYAEGHVNLGYALLAQDRRAEARAVLRAGLAHDPGLEDAHFLLAQLDQADGNSSLAAESLRRALSVRPDFAEARERLIEIEGAEGDVLAARRLWAEAERVYRRILALDAGRVAFRNALALVLFEQGRLHEARGSARWVLDQPAGGDPTPASGQRDPAAGKALLMSSAYCLLGMIAAAEESNDEAIGHFEEALRIDPESVVALARLSGLLREQGFLPEALDYCRKAVQRAPELSGGWSNLLTGLYYDPDVKPEELFAEHRRYADRFEAPYKTLWPRHANHRDPDRRLRIGYVSPDFRSHSVAYFILPVLRSHDKSRFEIVCYHDSRIHDGYTAEIERLADRFILSVDWSDSTLAERILADRIDILVDLTGHFGNNRLPAFARKPAPVQVTWIGSPCTTGLSAMDYRITDVQMDPPGMTEGYHSETLVRLPVFYTFEPSPESPPVNGLPALAGQPFTFACMNYPSKVNDRVIALWARILAALPESRLMIGNVGSQRYSLRLMSAFASHGIGAERLLLVPRKPVAEFLAMHHRMDLALDPFPFAGLTMSLHHLWMGVPILTLEGRTAASRQGVSVMNMAGWPDFIAKDHDDYVEKAIFWAHHPDRLNEVRQSLRERFSAALIHNERSPVVRNVEAAYRDMWQTWVERNSP